MSVRLRLVSTLLMFAIPLVLALCWAFMENLPFVNARLPVRVDASLPLVSRILAFIASMIPGRVAIYALSRLRRLFDLYAHGVIFREANVECFRQLGWSLFAWAGASFLFNTLADSSSPSTGSRAPACWSHPGRPGPHGRVHGPWWSLPWPG